MAQFWNTLNDILGVLDKEDTGRNTLGPVPWDFVPRMETLPYRPRPGEPPPQAVPVAADNAAPTPPSSVTVEGVGEPVVIQSEPKGLSDHEALTRMMFTEAVGQYRIPELFQAIGATAKNRVGAPGFESNDSLQGILFAPNPFQGVGDNDAKSAWTRSSNPGALSPEEKKAYDEAAGVAAGLLSGALSDNTGGATFFYSSKDGQPPRFLFQPHELVDGETWIIWLFRDSSG